MANTPQTSLPEPPLVLFDGVCNLCNATVQWIIERDPKAVFRFASLQSEAATEALSAVHPPVDIPSLPDSILLVEGDRVHVRSAAAIRIAQLLGAPYSMLAVTRVIPRPIRDAVYRFVARNRYRWFGQRETCMIPTPDLKERFLDAG